MMYNVAGRRAQVTERLIWETIAETITPIKNKKVIKTVVFAASQGTELYCMPSRNPAPMNTYQLLRKASAMVITLYIAISQCEAGLSQREIGFWGEVDG